MFLIEYDISDKEKERMRRINSIQEFEEQLDDIEGQISIECNKENIGFVNKDISYDGELLVTWFRQLNRVILYLRNNTYVAMIIPDSEDVWIEFEVVKNNLQIREVRAAKKHNEYIEITPLKKEKIFWSEDVGRKEVFHAIMQSTNRFIQEICLINKSLAESKNISTLRNIFNQVRKGLM